METKVKFVVPELEEYLPILTHFLLETNWKEKIFNFYPDLKKSLEASSNKEATIKSFFKKQESKFMSIMNIVQKEFQDSWDKINKKVINYLEKVNETKFLPSQKKIFARITLNPICPRYLDKNIFDIHFSLADVTMKTIVLHELSHFIFFNKLKKIYPDINAKEFESPNLIWKLSEMIPGIIFKDRRFLEIFEPQEGVIVYESINKITFKDKPILDILHKFYIENNFENFIKISYTFLREHENELNLNLI
jgi:hypothetical protein